MATAIPGAAAVISSGNRTARATMDDTAERLIEMREEDSSTTGSSVQLAMDHFELSPTPITSAGNAGNRSVTQNAATTKRRPGAVGLSMSASPAKFGRVAVNAITTGTAT